MGVADRQKWRIRIYNYSDSRILLERKKKWGSYIHKDSAVLTREKIKISENVSKITNPCFKGLWRLFDRESDKAIADVITLADEVIDDSRPYDIFDPELPTLSVLEPEVLVLEVKFTEFLPGLIRKLLPLDGQEFSAVSKYTLCYERAHHLTDALAGITKTNRREK